jgi:GT2 family glycosyltransferase
VKLKDGFRICAVLVTYGDRYHFLEQSIDALLEQSITHIIVVDNNACASSRKQLELKKKALNGKLEVVHLTENTGSAGGFHAGLQHASACEDCDFVWLLDDDNKPKKGALKALIDFWYDLQIKDKEHLIALMSYREDRKIYREIVFKNKPNLVIGKKNSSLGFHFCSFPAELSRRIKSKYSQKEKKKDLPRKKYGPVSAVPFGGMFFHKALLDTIGYPNRDLYLYSDDWEFSIRITSRGGKILLLLKSKIEDMEKSWHKKKNNKLLKIRLLAEMEDFRLYYYVRNRIYFEKKYLVTNPVIYSFNKLILLSFVYMLIFIIRPNNLRVIRKAVQDGNQGKLGRFRDPN